MSRQPYDPLRAIAIGSQAVGLMLIIYLETVLRDQARFWQGITLAVMLVVAAVIAVLRLYRGNKARKEAEAARRQHQD